jgi:hypothetical protein
METRRADYTDVSVIQKGTPRYQVTAVFGKPLESYKQDGNDVDVFQADPNGRKTSTKIVVNTFDTAADIFSLGLWELVATPAEMLTKHKLTTYVVTYAPDQTVASIEAVAAPPKPNEETAVTGSPTPSGTATPLDSASPTAMGSPSAKGSPGASAASSASAIPALNPSRLVGATPLVSVPPESPTE